LINNICVVVGANIIKGVKSILDHSLYTSPYLESWHDANLYALMITSTSTSTSIRLLNNREGYNIQYVEGFALQMSIIVLFEQMKSGDFKDKSGKISD
jgi:hypothetical protein